MFVFAVIPAFFIPETLRSRPPVLIELTPDSFIEETSDLKNSNYFTAIRLQTTKSLKRFYDSTTILHSLPILLLLLPFITTQFHRQAMDLSLRYISKRFSWKLSDTGFLLSLRALVNIILLAAILPALSYYLTERLLLSSKKKDLSIARVSAFLLAIGSFLMAMSPEIGFTIFGLVVMTLGTGFTSLVRSLITTLVDREHVARLYAVITMIEIVSAMIASPSIAGLYALGLKWKGGWIGLPFYFLALICFGAGMGVWCFRFIRKEREEMPYGDEDRDSICGNTMFMDNNSAL